MNIPFGQESNTTVIYSNASCKTEARDWQSYTTIIIINRCCIGLALDQLSVSTGMNSILTSVREHACWKKSGTLSNKVVVIVALMIAIKALLHAPKKIPVAKCPVGEPLSILHKYYEPGYFIIAGIFSQSYIFSSPISYEMPPSEESFDDLV